MANNHSTGSVPPCKTPTHKKIKVTKTYYPHLPSDQSHQKFDRVIPQIYMKGFWLEAAGFTINTPIKVRIMSGCLVLTAEEEPREG